MYPEPKFGMEYRALIETYRLAPEAAACQLESILERFFLDRRRRGTSDPGKPLKGGALH